MGCFLACFGSSKDKHRRNQQRYRVQHREQRYRNTTFEPVQSDVSSVPVWEKPVTPELKDEKPLYPQLKDERPFSPEVKDEKPFSPELKEEKPIIPELKEEKPISPELEQVSKKPVEQLSISTRKKVTFDSNVQTYEHVAINESSDRLFDSKECEKDKGEVGKNLVKSSQSKTSSEDGSITSSTGSYPPNHRYQNCRDSDDEDEPLDYDEDSDLYDDDDDDDDLENEDSDVDGELEYDTEVVESNAGTQVLTEDADSRRLKRPTGLCNNARDRNGYVHAVLNPVENLTQWKAVKGKKTSVMKYQKENFTLDEEPRISFSSEPSIKEVSSSFKSHKRQSVQARNPNQEMAVDASLSNWLGSSETTPINKASTIALDSSTPEKSMSYGSPHSARSHEDRPILGALTVEELRQFSASSSPRKSPSRSPDEMTIIGTVGSYWNNDTGPAKASGAASFKGIPNTTSKYREDRRVNWHSTPFETRLERALNRGAADANSSTDLPLVL